MGLSVVSNLAAVNTHRHLSLTSTALTRSLERLSSGYRINRAADDAAGLGISEGLRSQAGGLTQAIRNTRDGVSLVQVAEGALAETTAVLQRMRDLAVQVANEGALDGNATAAVQRELNQLKDELNRIADTTTFNGIPLLDGSYHRRFQVGADAGDSLAVGIGGAMTSQGLGVDALNIAAVDDPASVTAIPAQGRIEHLRAGGVVFLGTTADPGVVADLTGIITYEGHQLDLDAVDFTGATSTGEMVDLLNAAALAQGFTHRPDPFVDDGDDLIFRGLEPTAGATDAELDALTPAYDTPGPDVRVIAAQTSTPPSAGLLGFPGTLADALPTLRGTVSANGHSLELGAVGYTDTDGDGTVSGDEALAQLNAAAKLAGITADDHAFVVNSFITFSGDDYVDHGVSLYFTGATPTEGSSPEELSRLSPTFTPGRDLITRIDAAIRTVSTQRAELGAVQNRFEHTIAALGVATENTVASLSRIRDADIALETTALARHQILLQAGTAMLAQANQTPQLVLGLLQG
ncbi:flagellin N-terminal helical domain-containing protein [Modestobacter sp. VKM Ac-2984]|uniref:flagellin N-terminal helical domain-containing protein n=1 Tax=Modestobacter sp. VKM Ac-2984 TaxID=3004138 RepID=UPI0022AB0C55|nr:flagellin [Modestobacter sp. VKM Ac-2984]MCZ2817929.1 flagellin [Modestobacter sp. VKM Ac-2984]